MKITLSPQKAVILLLLILAHSSLIFAQNREKNLHDYLERIAAYGFSGQVLVAEKGTILLNRAYGYANRERNIPNQLDTVFNVASFTKQFTATAILRLESDGKLRTTDLISKYLENVPPDKSEITIHMLLSHASGLPRGQDGRRNTTRDETVVKILGQPLAAKPGEKFIYSNSGYHLLAAIIEKLSGRKYRDYIAEKLFRPAGMNRSGVFTDSKWKPDLIAHPLNEWGSVDTFTGWKNVWNYGSGSVVSTTGEIYKWLTALRADKIVARGEKEKLFRRYQESNDQGIFYGYGWFIDKLKDGSDLISHGGDNPGYHSEVRWYVKNDRVIIMLANYEVFEPDGAAVQKRVIANNISRILDNEEYKQPPAAVKLPNRDLQKYAGRYHLPDGSIFEVTRSGDSLKISAEGQAAIDAIAGYGGDAARKYAAANELTFFILENISAGAMEKIPDRMPKEDYDFYIPFLAKQIDGFSEKMGKLKEFRVQGTASFPWDANEYRTNVILRFEKGTTDMFLGWGDGRLDDVTTETGRTFPLIMPLVPQSRTEFSTFEIIRAKLTRLSFDKEAKELKIMIDDRELRATKSS
jgi:CubicO group peptidase (beta-lactamase class C family)